MAAVDAQLAQLQAQLNDLSRSMTAALATGQTQALDLFRAQFRELSAAAATLRTQASSSDAPSAFMRSLSDFSDQAIALGAKVGAPVGDLLRATSSLAKLLPWLVVAVVAGVLVLAYKGKLKGLV